jgi:hypothetical protein
VNHKYCSLSACQKYTRFSRCKANEIFSTLLCLLTCKSDRLAIRLVFSASSFRAKLCTTWSSRSKSLNMRSCRCTSCFIYCVRWSSLEINAIFSGSPMNSFSGTTRFRSVCNWFETRSIVSPIWVTRQIHAETIHC